MNALSAFVKKVLIMTQKINFKKIKKNFADGFMTPFMASKFVKEVSNYFDHLEAFHTLEHF